ncbi:MAG: hypothetical protein Q9208_006960 [Pyrenodesmia sp. 3 TL-2023]
MCFDCTQSFRSSPEMANKDTSLPVGGGPDGASHVFVRKRTQAKIRTYDFYKRADPWGSNSHNFKPERWQSKIRQSWSNLPLGVRSFASALAVSIGGAISGPWLMSPVPEQHTLLEVSYTLTLLLQVFPTIQSRDTDPWLGSLRTVSANDKGAKVALEAA